MDLSLPRMLIVVLHYGSAAMTRTVVEALRAGGAASHGGLDSHSQDVVVLDNAAPEAYAGAVRLPCNIFWGGALEQALAMARDGTYTHLWFCNNDITILQVSPPRSIVPRVLGRLMYAKKILGRPVGIWAPAVTRNPYHPQMVRQDGAEFSTVPYVDGIAPVLNVACIDAIGGLDGADNPRGYGLDVWLSMRAHEAGWPVVVDHQVYVRHDYHSTALTVEGFMAQAAADEQAYMSVRLGADWRAVVQDKQQILHKY